MCIRDRYESAYYGEVFHFDLYRLQSLEEALAIGIEEMIYSDAYCFIEWPELVENILPENVVNVRITVAENNVRLLNID